jgi:hypothetical protein
VSQPGLSAADEPDVANEAVSPSDGDRSPTRRPATTGTPPSRLVRWRLPAALTASTVVAVSLWLVASTRDSDGAEESPPGAPTETVPSAGGRTTTSPAQPPTTRPGRANVAHPAPSQVDAQRPRAVTLPSGVTMAVDASATGADGELMIPTDIKRAGWWDGSSRLGDPFGSVVIAAHVDSFSQGLGRFVELLGIRAGDLVTVRSHGLEQRFRVVSAQLVPKATVNAGSAIYSASGPSRLVLITCGGSYQADSGYADNMVVVAAPAGPLSSS